MLQTLMQEGSHDTWFRINDVKEIATPALVVYPERVRQNIDRAIAAVKDVRRLRPHFKTAKCAEVTRLFLEAGIRQAKCATIAEAEVLAASGMPDVLLAYQPVGQNMHRFLNLMSCFPQTVFSAVFDSVDVAKALSAAALQQSVRVHLYLDINVGMNRSGVLPDATALTLWEQAAALPNLNLKGLHAYDGHIKHQDVAARKAACDQAFKAVLHLMDALRQKGYPAMELIAGGSNSFLMHAQHADRQCSPGTFVYWDAGYAEAFPEQPFEPAALVWSTVVSLPDHQTITLDLGHKAIAAENILHQRMRFLTEPAAVPLSQSEEHLVVQVPPGHGHAIGDAWAVLPYHVCPTVALHQSALVVEGGQLTGEWLTVARNRKIGV